jgi:hypothetical protein
MALLAWGDDAHARRAQAQAALVRAQSEARQDLLAAMLPYVIFGVIALALVAIGGLIIYAIARRPQAPAPPRTRLIQAPPERIIERITERQIVFVLQPGQTRRDAFKLLAGADIKLIEGGNNGNNEH